VKMFQVVGPFLYTRVHAEDRCWKRNYTNGASSETSSRPPGMNYTANRDLCVLSTKCNKTAVAAI